MADSAAAEALVPKFQYERTLNQDQAGRRSALYGSIDGQPALLVLERAPFPTSAAYLGGVAGRLRWLQNLGANDVYHWYMGEPGDDDTHPPSDTASLKINLIWPCTPQHVRKYSRQGVRLVTETAAVYRDRVRPFMLAQRSAGRLAWVYNILEGRQEAADVLFRTAAPADTPATAADARGDNEHFLLLPDLNWDRRTAEALHLLALVARRDLWSLRDLRKRHVPWLRRMRDRLLDAAVDAAAATAALERDQLKLYVHYQPTYYHFHIHIVHVQLEAGATQAVGKAVALDSIIEQLEHMAGPPDAGMDAVTLTYTLGEASELWSAVFGPLKAQQALEAQEGQAD